MPVPGNLRAALLVTAWGLCGVASPGSAATLVSQERFVEHTDIDAAVVERVDATGFGAFEASVGPAAAMQDSGLGGVVIEAGVRHEVEAAEPPVVWGPTEHLKAESSFSVSFTVTEAARYTLSLDVLRVNTFGGSDLPISRAPNLANYRSAMEMRLVGPSTTEFEFTWEDELDCILEDCALDLSFESSGTLAPGTYTLSAWSFGEVESDTVCFGFGCQASFPIAVPSDGALTLRLLIVPPVPALPRVWRSMAGVVVLIIGGALAHRRRALR